MENLEFADLFCGAGGISIGLKKAGFSPKYAVDIWQASKKNYTEYSELKEAEFNQLDLLKPEDREKLIHILGNNKLTLLSGGPPCQGFSTMGKRKAGDKRNGLVDSFLDIISKTNPKIVIMENVTGLNSMIHECGLKYPQFISKFLDELKPGYFTCKVQLNGLDYGLAQTRKRVFFVCIRKDIWTNGLNFEDEFLKILESYKEEKLKVIKDVIYDLPRLESEEGDEELEVNGKVIYNHNVFKYSDILLKRFSFVKPGGGLRDIPDEYLPDHLLKVRKGAYGNGGLQKNVYGRLEWDKPSGTIVAGIKKITCGRFVHPENDRLLTVRECARIQGFPDDYKLTGSMTEQYTLVGNAVPPKFSEILGKAIRQILEKYI